VKNWVRNWTRGSLIYSIKSFNHNLGFFHKRKFLSWETGPQVFFKTKNQPTQKITNEGVKRANIPYRRVCNKSISTPKF
jgi:hypothetical protein